MSESERVIVRIGRGAEVLDLHVGENGWASLWEPEQPSRVAIVKIAGDPEGGRLVLLGVWIEFAAGVTSGELDRLPLGRIERAINTPSIAARIREGFAAETSERLKTPAWSVMSAPLAELAGMMGASSTTPVARRSRPRLTIPLTDSRRRGDEFYLRLAEVFGAQSGISGRPAADIAEANGVPVTTVHRWVKEARRRGLLEPFHVEVRAALEKKSSVE